MTGTNKWELDEGIKVLENLPDLLDALRVHDRPASLTVVGPEGEDHVIRSGAIFCFYYSPTHVNTIFFYFTSEQPLCNLWTRYRDVMRTWTELKHEDPDPAQYQVCFLFLKPAAGETGGFERGDPACFSGWWTSALCYDSDPALAYHCIRYGYASKP